MLASASSTVLAKHNKFLDTVAKEEDCAVLALKGEIVGQAKSVDELKQILQN